MVQSSNNKMELQGESLLWPFMWFTSVNISCMPLLSRLDNALRIYFGQLFVKILWTICILLHNWVSEYIFSLASHPYSHIVTSLQRSVITSGIGHQSLESVRNMTKGHLGKQWAHGHVHTQKGANNVLSKYYVFSIGCNPNGSVSYYGCMS